MMRKSHDLCSFHAGFVLFLKERRVDISVASACAFALGTVVATTDEAVPPPRLPVVDSVVEARREPAGTYKRSAYRPHSSFWPVDSTYSAFLELSFGRST
jgi:hypothetical protein